MDNSSQILKSWKTNSDEWIKLLKDQGIASRKITNKAIIEKIDEYRPGEILDMGCGEGWLTRSLSQKGYSVTGIDGTKELILQARSRGEQDYYQLTYEEIESGEEIHGGPYEAVIFNFSLYKEDLAPLFKKVKEVLKKNGLIFIQTIHPFFLIQNKLEYKGQWIEDSWKGLKGNFTDSHAWYARNLTDWFQMFMDCNLSIEDIKEPRDGTGYPVSIIFILKSQ